VFYAANLETSDWGKISGTTGRNTKVTGMLKSGKVKMGTGWVLVIESEIVIAKYKKYLGLI